MDNIKTWTGLSVEESVRMTEDRDKWRKYVHGVWPTLGSRTAKEQNRTEQNRILNDTNFRTVTVNDVALGPLNVALKGSPKNRGPL